MFMVRVAGRGSALLAFILLTGAAHAQDKFDAIPAGVADKYHFNFPLNLFATPAAEKADRGKLNALLTRLEKNKGRVAASPQNLGSTLELYDAVTRQLMRHQLANLDSAWLLLQIDLAALSQYAVTVRYPGMTADRIAAKDTLKTCRAVRDRARMHLGLPVTQATT